MKKRYLVYFSTGMDGVFDVEADDDNDAFNKAEEKLSAMSYEEQKEMLLEEFRNSGLGITNVIYWKDVD